MSISAVETQDYLRSRARSRRDQATGRFLGSPLLGALLLLASPSVSWAASPWTIADLIEYQDVSDMALSPDGSMAAWVQTEVVSSGEGSEGEGKKRVGRLFLWRQGTDAKASEPWQATFGDDQVASPVFSPDGLHVAFLSDRALPGKTPEGVKDKRQLWVLPLGGGEARALTRFDRSIRDFGWRSAGRLVVAVAEERSVRDRRLEEAKDNSVVVEDADHEPPVRLFEIDLEGTAKRLTDNVDWIDQLAVSPDGRWAVVRAQQSLSFQFDGRERPEMRLVDLEAGSETLILDDPALFVGAVVWALDSERFYFVNAFSRHPTYRTATIDQAWVFDLTSRQHRQVDLGWERGLSGGLAATRDGLVALLADGVAYRARRYGLSGGTARGEDLTGEHASRIDGWTVSNDGSTVLYRHSTASVPPQLYLARLGGTDLADAHQLTRLNPSYADRAMGRTEVLSWPGALDETVEGLLHYPYDFEPGKRYPLVLDIHGGPTSVDRDTWEANWHDPLRLIRQRGAFVLQVNYHGSSDYGLDWVESIGDGKYYELEPIDIENGVDHVIELGLADAERLGVTGWSNGGILAAELITRTRRYKVASIGAADVEWISDWSNVDFGATFDNYYFGASPWENSQLYLDKSPFFRLPEVTTPTIAFTGTEDRNVPPHQSWSLYRGLQQNTETPVRLVLFPGEPHGLRKIAHQRRKLEEEMAWIDRYLFDVEPDASTEWLRSGVPLAGLLARERAARVGVRYGVEVAGTLVPETVSFDGVELGRFEVTRAQFAAFSGSEVVAEEANLPASGVALQQARDYVAWLSRTTSRRYRLPTVTEAERWAKHAGSNGNTLAHWLGYSPTPEESAAVAERVTESSVSLLLAVGGFAPTWSPGIDDRSQPAVFDLDGNVAEWALDADGGEDGKAVGSSADRAEPKRGVKSVPGAEYVGLRVVVDD